MVKRIGSRTRVDKKRNLNTTQMADKLIVALVKIWEKAPAELSEPGFGVDIWELAAAASLIPKEEARQRRERYLNGAMDDFPSVQSLMKQKEWVTYSDQGEYSKYSKALYPTPKGIDYAHTKMRPWPVKVWKAVGKPTRDIVITIISLVAVAIITYFLTKYVLE